MKDIIPAKKQSPILGLTGMGGGVGSNLGGSLAKKTYMDDVFSTYLYSGTAGSQSINTGLDMTEGGLTWIKVRTQGFEHALFDTERGNNVLQSNSNINQVAYPDGLTSFNNNGFTLGADTSRGVVNQHGSGWDYLSWSFRKAKGFFDVVTYTGNGTIGRQIPHSLGSIPGWIMVKCTSESQGWSVYHRGLNGGTNPEQYHMELQSTNGENTTSDWNDTAATSTNFIVGDGTRINYNNKTYVAYLFAGGPSTAATAKSCPFDGNNDYLKIAASNDLNLDGAFTIEAWVNVDDGGWSGTRRTLLANNQGWGTNHAAISLMNSASSNEENTIILYNNTSTIADSSPVRIEPGDGWTHIAITRDSSNDIRIFKNGTKVGTTANYSGEFKFGFGETWIGAITMSTGSTPETYDGKISNLRVIKGTAVYTSSFVRPPYEPLTNITNTKLLCCNNISALASTVTPGTISSGGGLSEGSNDSPFDDPEGFKFGEEGDQNIIKCGDYVGDGNGGSSQGVANSQEIYVGWEPQWLLIKRTSASEGWMLFDSTRGIINSNGNDDKRVEANLPDAEASVNHIHLTSTGFTFTTSNGTVNANGDSYIYIAIRRPDGYVGKPTEAGTDVFAMDTGTQGNGEIPCFDSGFTVDYGLVRQPASASNWFSGSRLTGDRYLYTNLTNSQAQWTAMVWDSNVGFIKNQPSSYQGWMWKRHAGFDVVTWSGDDLVGRDIRHNLNAVPHMMWVKNRSSAEPWAVYHHGANGGINPWNYYGKLNQTSTFSSNPNMWGQTAPTSTHFRVIADNMTNGAGSDYIAMLFSSVDGISKVGSYTGTGSSHTVTVGFQPRFLFIKRIDAANSWYTINTLQGWGSGDDKYLQLDDTNAEADYDFGSPTSTGFTIPNDSNAIFNANGGEYIYYAHA